MRKWILVAAMASLLAGCAGSTRGDHVAGGALVGAGTGAVIGGGGRRAPADPPAPQSGSRGAKTASLCANTVDTNSV